MKREEGSRRNTLATYVDGQRARGASGDLTIHGGYSSGRKLEGLSSDLERTPLSCRSRGLAARGVLLAVVFVGSLVAATEARSAKPSKAEEQLGAGTAAYEHGDFREALRRFYVAAALGSAQAEYLVARMQEDGKGIEKSAPAAVPWYQRAAEKGNQAARLRLGEILFYGIGVTADPQEGMRLWGSAANDGSAEASFELALAFLRDEEIPRDPDSAARYARRAAEAGLPRAEGLLGSLYAEGVGVDRSLETAIEWYRRAASHGDATAQEILGEHFSTGKGVARDIPAAIGLFRQAISGGNRKARFRLGLLLRAESNSSQSKEEGNRLIREAAEAGEPGAQYDLAQQCLSESPSPNYSEAVGWLKKAAERGVVLAQVELALLLREGLGAAKDDVEATKLLVRAERAGSRDAAFYLAYADVFDEGKADVARRAALERLRTLGLEGSHEAQLTVGLVLWQGLFGEPDRVAAVEWFRRAAEGEYSLAQAALGEAYEEGSGVAQNYALALEWYRRAARSGEAKAFENLGSVFERGMGVRVDPVLAYAWYSLGAAKGRPLAEASRDRVARGMTSDQVSEAQVLSARVQGDPWMEHAIPREEVRKDSAAATRAEPSRRARQEDSPEDPPQTSSGTGFFVSQDGLLVTNAHVVEGCRSILVAGRKGEVIARNTKVDLALLRVPVSGNRAATFRAGKAPEAGDEIVVVGYPLPGILASEAIVTTGTISALAGLASDRRLIQISAPIQPGSSGAPVVDRGGNIVGIIVGTLGTLRMANATGTLPQNVNFAIGGQALREFLSSANVTPRRVVSTRNLEASKIRREAEGYTVRVECR